MRPQLFIFMTGVFVSSWIGGVFLTLGEWLIKKLPLVKHIYSAAKQVYFFPRTTNSDALYITNQFRQELPVNGNLKISGWSCEVSLSNKPEINLM